MIRMKLAALAGAAGIAATLAIGNPAGASTHALTWTQVTRNCQTHRWHCSPVSPAVRQFYGIAPRQPAEMVIGDTTRTYARERGNRVRVYVS